MFIEVGPLNGISISQQSPVPPLCVGCAEQTRIPSQGHNDATAIGKVHGNEVFHAEAKKAAAKWTFTPAIQNDKPVKVWVSLPFRFILN